MSDKIRGALFNILGDIDGLTVLDAFTGSGAIAYEAISRGAASVVAIDNRLEPIATVRANGRALGIEHKLTIIKADVAHWLGNSGSTTSFDVVICDPPYENIQSDVLVIAAQCVARGGIVALSLPPSAEPPLKTGFEMLRHKAYGDARLYFYRRLAA
jgi:16S rRNA (guanine966-N2)-methyltransferase